MGWIDWNMVLDTQGGPNHAENWCVAPVIARPERYIRPEAVRIGVAESPDDPMVTAFRNVDGRIVVALLNQSDSAVEYALTLDGRQANTSIAPSAVQTLILD